MIWKSKKAQIYFSAIFALVALPIILSSVIYVVGSKTESVNLPIGRDAAAVVSVEKEYRYALNYLYESAYYSASQAGYDLYSKGMGSRCGSIQGYSYWSKDCFNKDYMRKYYLITSEYLNDYLREYSEVRFPMNNYNLILDRSSIVGIAKNPVSIYIQSSGKNSGFYSRKPQFSVDLGIDLDKVAEDLKYQFIFSDISIDRCTDAICVSKSAQTIKGRLGYDIIFSQISSTVFVFDVDTGIDRMVYDNGFAKKDLTMKFAIDISGNKPSGDSVVLVPKTI